MKDDLIWFYPDCTKFQHFISLLNALGTWIRQFSVQLKDEKLLDAHGTKGQRKWDGDSNILFFNILLNIIVFFFPFCFVAFIIYYRLEFFYI